MGFVRYQNVRNRVLGAFAVIGATVGGIFGYQSISESSGTTDHTAASSQWEEERETSSPEIATPSQNMTSPAQSLVQRESQARPTAPRQATSQPKQTTQRRPTKTDRYVSAMKLATSSSRRSAKAKDVLGSRSPWKLNLYDDNQDGTWDRAKLDTNRDEVDDEKWTFKKGRWEKDDGKFVWANDNWVSAASIANAPAPTTDLGRYRAAFIIAGSVANSSGKGKYTLGPESPWKLNLYDDDKDGQWDRAKLDTNRDEIDDEKWTFKNNRWEKENGTKVWATDNWVSASLAANQASDLQRYLAAFKVAGARADSSGKGKDVLGSQSPWKLNLYDDDKDGQWDRAKLDTNRDEVDDEKWTFKQGRWEKENGSKIWVGDRWE